MIQSTDRPSDRQTDRQTDNSFVVTLSCCVLRSCAVIGCNIKLIGAQSGPSAHCTTFSRRQCKISNMPDIQKPSGSGRRARLSGPCLLAVHITQRDQNVADESLILPKIVGYVGEQQKSPATTESSHYRSHYRRVCPSHYWHTNPFLICYLDEPMDHKNP